MAKNNSDNPAILSEKNAADAMVLLQRIAKKDVVALDILYDTFSGLLMSIILPILKDQLEAEEALQDSFITIWNKAHMYQTHLGKPTSWMVTIAKNKAYDRYRKLVRTSEGLRALKESVTQQSDTYQSDNGHEALERCLKKINPEQRSAINLVFYQGFTQQEASHDLGAPLGTIKARIRRGLIQLKQCLSNS